MFKVKITKNGPYIVTGLKNLVQEAYAPNSHGVLVNDEMQRFPEQKEYYLCRCGQSKNAPFCDGSHEKVGFDGAETADQTPYIDRSEIFKGPRVEMLDDERCAFARFCHREKGEVWTLTEQSEDPENAREAVEGASSCPSGRLTSIVDGQLVEAEYEDTIGIAEDPANRVSASLNVRGDFELEGSDGSIYEKRNRLSLCRCGKSRNKPFCDASHVNDGFDDHISGKVE